MNRLALIAAAVLAALIFTGCVNKAPVIHSETGPSRTPTPAATEEAERTAPPETDITPEPAEVTPQPADYNPNRTRMDVKDALGRIISGPEHYTRYLTFRTMLVYEEDQDTFLDGTIRNDYSRPITCAVDVVYYDDEGAELARARLQTRDGQYLLVLEPGNTVVYAHILTDITLTEREYELEYDMDVGVRPLN